MGKNRLAHKLTKNKTKQTPRNRIYFDSESRVNPETLEHKPYLIVACFIDSRYEKETWKEYLEGNLNQFWADAAGAGSKKEAVTIYAHNAGYDLMVTGGITVLVSLGFVVTSFFEKGTTFIMRFRRYKDNGQVDKTINLVSSTNYFTSSLAALGPVFGLEKLDYDYDGGSIEEAITYCRRDVEILKTAVETFISFVQAENLGCLAMTTPGQAFNAFRHRFMKSEIYLHSNPAAWELERESYYGGRVECWQVGRFTSDSGFFGFDINSMYPYVMLKHAYPVKLLTVKKYISLEKIEKVLEAGFGICAEVAVKVEKPVFPVRVKGNLIFPVGEFRTFLTTPEIIYGLEQKLIKRVYKAAIYSMDKIFTDYVDYFYAKRLGAKKEGNKVYDMLYKLFLNSLYGKFGQKSDEWKRVGDAPGDKVESGEIYNADTGEMTSYKIFGGSIFYQQEESESFNSFCAVAAHVTAYARMLLLSYIEMAGPENVYYMDTDSLFVNAAGAARLEAAGGIDPYRLGAMKLEKQDKEILINTPKDYRFAGVVKLKGIKKNAQKLNPGEYLNIQWPRLFGQVRAGKITGFSNVRRIKVISGDYYKGWIKDNGQVIPFRITGGLIDRPEYIPGWQIKLMKKRFKGFTNF